MTRLAYPAVFAVLFVCSTAIAEESSEADFADFLKAFEGRWLTEMELTTSQAAFGKQGDIVSAQAHCKVVSDGKAMLVQGFGGSGAVTWLVSYDAKAKRIKTFETDSAGDLMQGVFFRNDGKWIREASGSSADGDTKTVRTSLTISDAGDTHTWTGTNTRSGDKSEFKATWRRVSKRP